MVMGQLVPVFAGVDSSSGGINVGKLKADYEEMVRAECAEMGPPYCGLTPDNRRSAAPLGA